MGPSARVVSHPAELEHESQMLLRGQEAGPGLLLLLMLLLLLRGWGSACFLQDGSREPGCPVRGGPAALCGHCREGAAALKPRSPWHGLCLRFGSGVSRARCPLPVPFGGGSWPQAEGPGAEQEAEAVT